MFTDTNPDRREATRERALLSARVTWGDGAYGVDASVMQISKTGARLTLSQPHATPGDVHIDIPRRDISANAHVVRRDGRDIAIQFVEDAFAVPPSIEKLRFLAEEIAALKRENSVLRSELTRLRGG